MPVPLSADPKRFIATAVNDLIDRKAHAKAYGTTTVEITFKDGRVELLRLKDETTHKFPAPAKRAA